MDLGSKIRNIRYNHNLSQDEMSKILGINRNFLSRIETNKSLPTAEILEKLAVNYNISIDSLLGINLDSRGSVEVRKEKIKKITQYCLHLSNAELDFILNMLFVMNNNSNKFR